MAFTKATDIPNAIMAYIHLQIQSTFPDKLFMPHLVTNEFSELNADGDRVAVNSYGIATTQNAQDGFTPEALSESSVDVIMDQWKTASFGIDSKARMMGIHQWKKAILKRIIEPIGNTLEDALLGLYVDATTYNYTATGANGGLKYDDLIVIRKYLKDVNAEVNENGRYNLVIGTYDEKELLLLQKFIDAGYTGDGGRAIRDAFLGHRSGFDVFASNRIPASGASPTSYHSMAFGSSAMGIVSRTPNEPLVKGGAIIEYITDKRTGFTFRVTISFDHTGGFVSNVSADILYGVKTLEESHMVDILSQSTP